MSIIDEILSQNDREKKPVSDWLQKLSEVEFDINAAPKGVEFVLSAVIELREYNIGARGMLGVVSGVAKSRKTTFLSAIVASALSGRDIINMRLRPGGPVVFFDTEQPDYFFYMTQKRTYQMAGLTTNVDWYKAYALRSFSPDERISAIDYVMQHQAPAVVIIDGVLDLVHDMNDLRESQAVAQQLMAWSKAHNCLVIIVLHRNESFSGRGKMAGHLGSVITRKADWEITLKIDDATNFTHVKHCPSRIRQFPVFAFTQDEKGFPVLSPGEQFSIEQIDEPPF